MRIRLASRRCRSKTRSFCFLEKRVPGFPDKRPNRLAIFRASPRGSAATLAPASSGLSEAAAETEVVADVPIVVAIVAETVAAAAGVLNAVDRAAVTSRIAADTMATRATDIRAALSSSPKC